MKAPIRVVVFGGGPVLEPDVQAFLVALAEEAAIDVLAVICQSVGQGWSAIATDLWRRRGLLALPIFVWQQVSLLLSWRQRRQLSNRLEALRPRVHFVPDIHAPGVVKLVSELQPDLGLIYGAPILRPALFELPQLGTLGIHHGKVPTYRGKKTTFWAMYNGEVSAGVTIQLVNARLDQGAIVKQGEVLIADKSYGVVWAELVELGIRLYLEAILQIRAGSAYFQPQTENGGHLYRDPTIIDLMNFYRRRRFGLPPLQDKR